MNTKNNRRRQQSQEKIESVFLSFLEEKEINQITVADICKQTGLNRSTFYANYQDIYDLVEKLRQRLVVEMDALYENDIANKAYTDSYLRLFYHVRDHQQVYRIYFKLGLDQKYPINIHKLDQEVRLLCGDHLEYHITFHKAGFAALIKRWLDRGCQETPEEMCGIIRSEYRGRSVKIFE